MKKILSVVNNKGGVAKTTSILIFSELLAYLGKKVLTVDLDGQSNLSLALHQYVEDTSASIAGRIAPSKKNIAEIFKERPKHKEQLLDFIYPTPIKNISIIPSSKRFNSIESNMDPCFKSPFILNKALTAIKEDFDFILIDNAPALDFFTLNSIVASDYIVTPIREDGFSKKGLFEIMETINNLTEDYDLSLTFLGAFLTQVNPSTIAVKERIREYKESIPDYFFNTYIRKDTKIAQIESEFKPILEHSLDSNALLDYSHLLLELGILDDLSKQRLGMSL